MKKWVLIFIVVAILCLSACGNSDNFDEETRTTYTTVRGAGSEIDDTVTTNIRTTSVHSSATSSQTKETVAPTTIPTIVDKPTENEITLDSVKSLNELEEMIEEEFEEIVGALEEECSNLISSIRSFDDYVDNVDQVEAFYDKINATAEQMSVRMYEYALRYAEIVMDSRSSADDKYDDFDELYDCIYDDAGDILYDDVYDGILDDLYDEIYDGVIDDAYDMVPYKEWSRARSNEYDFWSDTRSDVYDFWSDARSDIYDFWSDIRSDLWDEDISKAYETLKDFKEDVVKIKN